MHEGPVLIDGSPERRTSPASEHDIRLTLPASAENVVLVRHVVTGLAQALNLPARLTEDLRLAVTEACTNVVRHAYAGRRGNLEVQLRRETPEALIVTVSDEGGGLRPWVHSDGPGLGLPLMAAVAQGLEIEQRPGCGSRVRMRFLVGG